MNPATGEQQSGEEVPDDIIVEETLVEFLAVTPDGELISAIDEEEKDGQNEEDKKEDEEEADDAN
jgi:hypothetical protein